MDNDYTIIKSSYPSMESAKGAARNLIGQRMAACAKVIPCESVYVWNGTIAEDTETVLLIITHRDLFCVVEREIKESHPYDVPEIIQIPIINGTEDYLNWIDENTKSKRR